MGYSMDEYENDPALKALFKKAIAKYRKTGAMDEAVETDSKSLTEDKLNEDSWDDLPQWAYYQRALKNIVRLSKEPDYDFDFFEECDKVANRYGKRVEEVKKDVEKMMYKNESLTEDKEGKIKVGDEVRVLRGHNLPDYRGKVKEINKSSGYVVDLDNGSYITIPKTSKLISKMKYENLKGSREGFIKHTKNGTMGEDIESDNVYDWYKSKAPDDYQLDLINKKVTFTDLAKKLKKGRDRRYYHLSSKDVGVGEYIDSAPLDDITSETIRRAGLKESNLSSEDIDLWRGANSQMDSAEFDRQIAAFKGRGYYDITYSNGWKSVQSDGYFENQEDFVNFLERNSQFSPKSYTKEFKVVSIKPSKLAEAKHSKQTTRRDQGKRARLKLGEAPMTQKDKAIECLTKCNIYKPYIKAFEEKGIVTLFEQGMGYYIDESSEPTCYKQIQKMASEGNMVWAVTHEMTEFGELYDFLFVPKSKSEWKYSLDGSGNSFYAYAYVLNTTDEWNSEYGDIVIRPIFGGIQRVG